MSSPPPLCASPSVKVAFFKSLEKFRAWLKAHHDKKTELWVGFYKKDSGKTGMSYFEAVDQALCFGWIDGIKKRFDNISYTHRFTPRKPRSHWSLTNIQRVSELERLGLMMPAGLNAFARRDKKRAGRYSYERKRAQFDGPLIRHFATNKIAWSFFCAQPPGYQRTATWWVIRAKKTETRFRRLAKLIEDSRQGRRLAMLTSPKAASR